MALVPATSRSGTNGTNGSSVLNGSGAPGAGLGANGDFYIDTTADAIYGPKAAGAWGSGTSLIGPAGAGFAIGSSRLQVQSSGTGAVALGSTTDILWDEVPTIVGSDLAVHGANKTLIDILTAGTYVFVACVAFSSATATIGNANGQVGFQPGQALESAFAVDGQDLSVMVATVPQVFAANAQVSFECYADNATSTGTYVQTANTYLYATRLA